ncbi:PH domain-containing protein [Paenibacillus arenilitoris]|uniref:PH domain-containing protein n=1 Tax=Paenibacillus arenilitoris TaxID=2772299 RepID=A0A927CS48_9BACL|nr:PH domain-containing protein [Paenibacillus arenilitoris]MBD2870911.1 PH domain-containing protein [Paenibacillus arenilitoris]
MSERRKLHPVYILFGLVNTIQGFLPFLLIALFKGIEWSELRWYWYAGPAALAAVILVFSFIEWKRFGFWLETDRIIIRRGSLFRDEKTIYYARIHSVNVEQPLIQRLLGVAQVKIETPGGNKKADGVLPALSLAEATRIQQMLKSHAQRMAGSGEAETVKPEPITAASGERPTDSADAADDTRLVATAVVAADGPAFRLTSAQLLQAAATSMNFGLVAAFVAGLYSFADDFIDAMLPEHFFEQVVEDSVSLMPSYFLIAAIALIGLVFAWLLSVVLYLLKYSGFSVARDGRQITVSYGMLEKKSFVFDPKKVQAVIVKEGMLRQAIGYAEIQLQVISSDKKEQLMLHPFIKRADVHGALADFVPQLKLPASEELKGAPKRALLYYMRIALLIVVILCVALIVLFKAAGLWSLLLIPLVAAWRLSCHGAAGVLLANGQLTLRRRFIARSTYLIRRPQIVTMRVNRSSRQQRKKLLSLSVHALGSPFDYSVACLDRADVEPVWRWYSRSHGRE